VARHVQRGVVGYQGKGFLDRFRGRFESLVRKRNLDVIAPLQSFGNDIRHLLVGAREWTKRFEQHQALHLFWKRGGVKQTHTAAERMTDDRQRLLVQMLEQTGQICEKIFMSVTAARARPLAIAMAAQVERHRMFDRHAAPKQRSEKLIPAPSLIAHTVYKDIGFFLRITPLPVMHLQSVVNKVSLFRF
jgi:hypothetical protein